MLKSVDILIGLTIVLLALSMAVTMITQSVTTVLNSRGRHLRRGLVDLLQQLDPALTETLSRAVATRILTHPLVSGSNTPVAAGSPLEAVTSTIDRIRRSIGGLVSATSFIGRSSRNCSCHSPQARAPGSSRPRRKVR